MYSLTLWGRPAESEPFQGNITRVAKGWQRSTRAEGGYWSGGFTIHADDMSLTLMTDFYNRNLGRIVREYAAGGMLSWEGYIVEMRLVLDGLEHMRSLRPEWFHNRVQVRYTWPESDFISVGGEGAMTWDPNWPDDGFKDDGMDFSPYAAAAVPGPATYMLEVTCTDDDETKIWGFMGDVGAGGNDEIDIYEDSGLVNEGWAVQDVNRALKTPAVWKIQDVTRSGQPTTTDWSENTDSSDQYGQLSYIETIGTLPMSAAEMLRDRHLTEYAWPRSRLVGQAVVGARPPADRLVVTVAGFWHTMNWRYLAVSKPATCYALIDYLVGLSEFVTAGRLELNEWEGYADCEPVPQRLSDLCSDVINLGDESGNIWQGGVYGGRKFRYEAAPTTVAYYLHGRVLTDRAGIEALPPLVEPGFLMRTSGVLLAGQPSGVSSVWDDPQVAYVNEVEFAAPDKLKLVLYRGESSIITLLEQGRMWGLMRGALEG